MIKKTIFALFLTLVAISPFSSQRAEAAAPIDEKAQIARVNWNINIGGCGGCYGPGYYPYYYSCPPPYAYPYPPYGGPCGGPYGGFGFWWY